MGWEILEIHQRDVLHGIQAPLDGLAQFIMPHRFPRQKTYNRKSNAHNPPHSDLSLSLYHSVLTGNSFRSTRTTFKSQFATQPRFRSPPFELIKCTMSLLFGGAYFKILEVSMIQTYPNVSNGFPVFSKAALRFIFLCPESTFPLMVSRKASTSEAKTHQ